MIITNDTSDDLSFIREFNYPEKMEGLAIIKLPDCKLALSVCYSLPLKSGSLLKIMVVFPNPSDENFEFRDYYKNKGDIARALLYFYTIYGLNITKKNKSFFTSMLPNLCRWHRHDKVDSTEYKRSKAIARIQSNINPFIFDPSLAERCYCSTYPTIILKPHIVNIYPNPSKGLFYIDIPNYTGPVIMKISTQSGKLLETHHLVYSALMSWRLDSGIYNLNFHLIDQNNLVNNSFNKLNISF